MIDLGFLKSKPSEIKLPANTDYLKLFYCLRQSFDRSYLFESLALPKQQDRYYTFGFDPLYVFSARGKELSISSPDGEITRQVENPYLSLKSILPKYPMSKTHEGGLIGYFSYETVNYFEPKLNLPEHEDFPVFELGLYVDGLLYDSETAELTYYTFHEDRSHVVLNAINNLDSLDIPTALKSVKNQGRPVSAGKFKSAVISTLDEIKRGNTFQVEVGFKNYYYIEGDKFAIYQKLREINPSPYMYYLKFGERELFGASPELVGSCTDGRILTTPAAGTIKRGKTHEEDQELSRQLLNDPKEIAEHAMLVDMHRNDISKVCKPGSVKISRLMHLMKFSYVQHIVSDVIGELQEDKDSFDLLNSILPCGVLTGAPKIETIKIIARNERRPRGPYGGGVGRLSFNGDCVFAMPIRSLFCAGNKCFSQACAGIVFDSVPENEYTEVSNKLKAMEKTILEASP
ncbi:anthranilate synthase component I family protein [Candidatus Parcubacteria bacterium]|nr:anthranilate synthase component I family protein [Candidatus Parcubacteria bacterium]